MGEGVEENGRTVEQEIHALHKVEGVGLEPSAKHAVLKQRFELLFFMKFKRTVAFLDIFIFRDKDDLVIVKIIKQGRGLVVDEGDELVVGRKAQPRAQHIRLLLQAFFRFFTALAFEIRGFLADFVRKLFFVADQNLARGGEGDLFAVVGAALGLDVEIIDGVDLVAPQLDTHGRFAVRHEQVDQSAADGELTAALDVVTALIAEQDQRLLKFCHVDLDIGLEGAGDGSKNIFGNGELRCRVESRDNDVIIAAEHTAENIQSLVLIFVGLDLRGNIDEVLLRVDQRFETHCGQVVAHYLCFLLVLGNTKGSDGVIPAERRDDIGFVDSRYADRGGAGACTNGVVQRLVLLGALNDLI